MFSGVMDNNSIVFFNGIKVKSGDYVTSGSNLVFNSGFYFGAQGTLNVLSLSGNYSQKSGSILNNYNIAPNNPNYSLIFMNGQEMIKDYDYLSISRFSMLTGSGIFINSPNNIYNDLNSTDLFWN